MADDEARYRHWLPWWMHTAGGRWLATHTAVFARAWVRGMNHALAEEARHDLMDARVDLQALTERFVFGKATRSELLRAVIHVRNATAAYIRRTTGEAAAQAYFETMDKIDRDEFSRGATQ